MFLILIVAAVALVALAAVVRMGAEGVLIPTTEHPWPASDLVCKNGEASTAIVAGNLVYKENEASREVKVTPSGKPVGIVGVALDSAAAGADCRVRFFGRFQASDMSTGVCNTDAITAAGDTMTCAASGALATWATAAERRVGFVMVKSATVGVGFINGFQG